MKRIHDKIDKENAPKVGEQYVLRLSGEELYSAEVIEYKGGCWAKIKVNEPLHPEYSALYKNGDVFDVKIASYEFENIS
jgi:hypothetical protein